MYNSDDVYDSEDRTVWSFRNILLSIIGLAIVVFVPRIYSFRAFFTSVDCVWHGVVHESIFTRLTETGSSGGG